jgi:hypothetical protein
MATRSRIALETLNEQGKIIIKSIYCHWDGYPDYNGKILFTYYNDRNKVEKLINLGDLSILNATLQDTVAYHRDKKEEYSLPKEHSSLEDFIKSDIEEYGYLFTLNNEWILIDGHTNERKIIPLINELTFLDKNTINFLIKLRVKYIDSDIDTKQIEDIHLKIKNEFINNFYSYEVEFILETLAKLGYSFSLIYDDNGLYAVTGDGYSPVTLDEKKIEGTFYSFVTEEQWKPTIRESLFLFLKE